MAKPVKHYGKWRIRWIDADGGRRSEVYDRYEDADFSLKRHKIEAKEIQRGLKRRKPKAHTIKRRKPEAGLLY